MNKEATVLLGRISKVHGKDGAVVIHIRPGLFDAVETQKAIFVGINDYVVPYFIEWIQDLSDDELKVKFEEIDSPEDAAAFTGKDVYIPKVSEGDKGKKSFSVDEIIGFTVIDEVHGNIGTIAEVMELPQQEILKVVSETGKEILIPLVEELIVAFDVETKVIEIAAPEGLIELYLGEE